MIEVWHLGKEYVMGSTTVHALRGAGLRIESGEFVTIMGPSGSGKSTLMNILGCLDRPSKGSYNLAGEEVSKMTDDQLADIRNRRIGFIFQTFNLLPRLSALQNVELPLVYRGMPASERRRKSEECLERVGLSERMRHRPNELSGGQQQRVAIARALAGSPAIILADEPTGNLDSRSGEEVMAIFQELNESGITIILVTHDEWIARHAKRVVRLRDGLIVSDELVSGRVRAQDELGRMPALEVAGQ
ncbi:MAG: ABC transporter ATP-binding protein [Bacillota bacterium]|nr:ABC transporter ATP-binding protein [Bacillota bacterium]